MNQFDISDELRVLADGIPENEEVLLPAVKPSEWEKNEVYTEFEKINLAEFLRFVAEMTGLMHIGKGKFL